MKKILIVLAIAALATCVYKSTANDPKPIYYDIHFDNFCKGVC